MRFLRFHDFELDTELFRLSRGNTPVEIGRRSFDLLMYLAANHERIVSSSELVSEVWKSKAISPSAIPTCLMELRRLLGDSPQEPKIIRTSTGRGYQFIAKLNAPASADLFIAEDPEELHFAGRDRELTVLGAMFDTVRQCRQSRTAIIRGEAGIGKTRLLQEFIRSLPRNTQSFVFRCPEVDGAPAFLPWLRLKSEIERALSSLSGNPIPADLQDDRQHSEKAPRPTLAGRFDFFEDWSALIRALCSHGPVLLAIEDIHRTDVDTVELFDWIGSDLLSERIMLVATMRATPTDTRLNRSLSKISARFPGAVLDLSLLDEPSLEKMVSERTLQPQLVARELFQRTSGHPFFVRHIMGAIHSLDSVEDLEEAIHRIPKTAAELLTHQLQDLPRPTREALMTGALFGKTIPLELAAAVHEVPVESFISDISPAISAGLITEFDTDASHMCFSHMILRDALYDTFEADKRRALHARVADQLIRRSEEVYEDNDGIIAQHLEKALPISDFATIARFRRAAGRSHLQKFAFTEARTSLARACEIVTNKALLSIDEECHLRFELAEAQLYSLDRTAARLTLFEAADIARRSKSAVLLGECAIRISPNFLAIEVGPFDPEHIEILKEAIREIPSYETALRARVLARLSIAVAWSDTSGQSEHYSLEALSLAIQAGDPETMASALAARSDALHGPDRLPERLSTNDRLQAAVRKTNDRHGIVMHHVRQAGALLDAGKIQQLDAEITACELASRSVNAPHYAWYPIAFRAMRALMKGDLAEATTLGDRFVVVGHRTGDLNVPAARVCQYCAVKLELDEARSAVDQAEPFMVQFPGVRAWAAGIGMLNLHSGRPDRANEILDTFDAASIRNIFHEPGGAAGVAFLAEIAVHVGDQRRIAQLYDICSPVRERSATLGYAIWYYGCFARYAGLLAGALNLHSEAQEHLRAAILYEKRRGATLWRIHAELDLAQELLTQEQDISEIGDLLKSADASTTKRGLLRAKRRGKLLAEAAERAVR